MVAVCVEADARGCFVQGDERPGQHDIFVCNYMLTDIMAAGICGIMALLESAALHHREEGADQNSSTVHNKGS